MNNTDFNQKKSDIDPSIIASAYSESDGLLKIIDFRNRLTAAAPEQYAHIHQLKTEGNRYPSAIRIVICESGGDKLSTTLAINVEPSFIFQLMDLCRSNNSATRYTVPLVRYDSNRKTLVNTDLAHVYGILTRTNNQKQFLTISAAKDCRIRKIKFFGKKARPDGYAPFQQLQINRDMFRKDRQIARYPWFISITHGFARPQQDNRNEPDMSTMTEYKRVYLNINDDDMYRIVHSTVRFIELWEMTNCIAVIREGLNYQELKRQEYETRQKNKNPRSSQPRNGTFADNNKSQNNNYNRKPMPQQNSQPSDYYDPYPYPDPDYDMYDPYDGYPY